MNSDLSRQVLETKIRLIHHCFEGNDVESKETYECLEKLLKRKPISVDFPTYHDPTIAACLGGRYDLAAHFIDIGATVVTQSSVSAADKELPHLLRVWVKPHTSMIPTNRDEPWLQALWQRKQLCTFQSNWLEFPIYRSALVEIDLSYNSLLSIPELLLWGLPALQELNLSHNKLQSLPGPVDEERLENSCLETLLLHDNHLNGVPVEVFQLPNIERIELQHNLITSLDPTDYVSRLGRHGIDERWSCARLKYLDLRDNHLVKLPSSAMQGATELSELVVSHNGLRELPPSWSCRLVTLKAGENLIEAIPDLHHWDLTLKTLILNDNRLEDIPDSICHLVALDSLNLENNLLKRLPPRNKCKIFQLHSLNLSGNQLTYAAASDNISTPKERRSSKIFSSSIFHVEIPTTTPSSPVDTPDGKATYGPRPDEAFDFLNALSGSLKTLQLARNTHLQAVPPCVCRLHRLFNLDLSGNVNLEKLPYELGSIDHLVQLKVPDNIKDPEEVAEIIQQKPTRTTERILWMLRDRLYQSEPYRGMKLMVVGPAKGGKTTLVGNLIGNPQWPEDDEFINTYEWKLTDPSFKQPTFKRKTSDENKVNFTIWDLKGGDSFDSIHPCLYTSMCLYLVVWNGRDDLNTVDNLQYRIADIKQKAPNSEIILVCTHQDEHRHDRGKRLSREEIRRRLTDNFNIHFVSSEVNKKESIHALKATIYQCAVTAKMSRSNAIQQHIVGRKVPKSFTILQQVLNIKRSTGDHKYILAREDMQQLLVKEYIKGIDSDERVQQALDFLTISGTILTVKIRSGRRLHILDPSWLYTMLYSITQISNSDLRYDSTCPYSTLVKVSAENGLEDRPEDFLQLVEGLEVALPVDKDRRSFWIPTKLPRDKPAITFASEDIPCLRRYYKLPYTPPGLWVRLVSRLVVSLKQYGQHTRTDRRQSNTGEHDIVSNDLHRVLSRDNPGDLGLNLRLKSLCYWQEGILATHDSGVGRILVEKQKFGNDGSGIGIQVHCRLAEFKEIGFVVDHIDTLIKDWYPGLVEDFQYERDATASSVCCLIPCPDCCKDSGHPSRDTDDFILAEELIIAATYEMKQETVCKRNGHTLMLKSVVPDVFLADLQVDVFSKSQLEDVHFSEEYRIGKGGYGVVFRAAHNGEKVAVKTLAQIRLLQVQDKQKLDNCEYERKQWIESFGKYRAEVAMMSKLKHPHIVEIRWACIQTLSFAMEFAPEGDLSAVLEKKLTEFQLRHTGRREIHDTVLDRLLSYKMVVQMAAAVSYLHSNDLIYCDLKTDNALVFSMDPLDPVNIKLTDYGISRQLIGPGGHGDAGPPGFCAPEILQNDIFGQKADWFSFGMVLYHLLSGMWPYNDLERSETMDATLRGDRPDFRFCGYTLTSSLPGLKTLMEDCWQQKPQNRSAGEDIIQALSDASLLCFRQVIRLEDAALIGMFCADENNNDQHNLHIWSCKPRSCVYYNQFNICDIDIPLDPNPTTTFTLPDATSSSQCVNVTGNLHIIDTMFNGIHIYERVFNNEIDSSASTFERQVILPAADSPVESLCCQTLQPSKDPLSEPKGRLFVGYQHNTVRVFTQNRSGLWDTDPTIHRRIDLDNKRDAPCSNMQLMANDTSEICFTCGNKVMVAVVKPGVKNHDTLEVLQSIDVVDESEATIGGMICQPGFMWCYVISNATHRILQYDIQKQTFAGRLQLNNAVKVGDDLAVNPSTTITDEPEMTVEDITGKDEPAHEELELETYVQCFRVDQSVLWVGTCTGKTLAINVSEVHYGEVLGILSLGEPTGPLKYHQETGVPTGEPTGEPTGPLRYHLEGCVPGPVKHIVEAGDDTLIAYQEIRLRTQESSQKFKGRAQRSPVSRQTSQYVSKYRLVIWDKWDLKRFHWFQKVRQSLNS